MGILGWLADSLTDVLRAIGHVTLGKIGTLRGIILAVPSAVASIFGIKIRKKPPSDKIRAELRKQWLELAPGEREVPGVEWEGEIYYETPK